VFKKLDKLIIKAFIGPFIATFFITLLVLIMQFFWLYIDDFVGKGIDTKIIFEFILYQSAVLVPLALPLAVLLSSLMTFGNLGESFELVAIKSAGISLLRFMRPLFLLTVFISFIAFLFSNYVIPVANLKSRTLLADIIYSKPAFNLKEGVFFDGINGFSIKIGKKQGDSLLKDIIIYEQGNTLQDNFIIADSGVMHVTPNRRFLEFNLKDGWRYQERGNAYDKQEGEYIRIGFKEYKKRFDLSQLGFNNRTNDSVNKNNERMLSMRQLEKAIDSLKKENKAFVEQGKVDNFRGYHFPRYLDSNWQAVKLPPGIKNFEQLIPDSAISSVTNTVRNATGSLRMNAETLDATIKGKEKTLRKHKIEWHRKIALSAACLVLFLIGAPLGSIIRKGGLGSPLIFAIVFFMVFYFASTTGEKSASVNTLTPFVGMWLATFILVPIGIFLTYKAMHDSQLFRKEAYSRLFRFFGSKKTS
jgi:lipopolysaccharide export system permease protein